MNDTKPRTALVTGASTGIGRATALALAHAGFDLAVTDLDASWLADVAAEAQGRQVVPIALELRSEDSIAKAVTQAADALGAIDLLVNNAGRPLQKPATDVTWAEWNDVIDINLKGSFFLSTAFARHCGSRGRGGAVVSLASTHGLTGIAGRSVYGISKGGIIQMTRMLAIEWAPLGIRVNASRRRPCSHRHEQPCSATPRPARACWRAFRSVVSRRWTKSPQRCAIS